MITGSEKYDFILQSVSYFAPIQTKAFTVAAFYLVLLLLF